MNITHPQTARLRLRPWTTHDSAGFARLNADARVMRHFPAVLTAPQSDALLARFMAHWAEHGWGPWAMELRDSGRFLGVVGLAVPAHPLPFSPCVEIFWRLDADYWGQGLVPEAAAEVVRQGFAERGLDNIVAFTTPDNRQSWRVMEKLGMTRRGEFMHPALPAGDPLCRHVLYQLDRASWQQGKR
ncbi:GNAT family N-acetyltransferase [Shimwellia pseudoproteus]|uniref:GNAT family N-acetyltransferase n=1 Tax=Shimwellia pseudoproteus TaxID=570012 RepID=UPI0018ED8ED9|nr:GNAT family N-acetyltransferase [Shimwellia pseudoproteus]MBJ3817044.1 GNAT family N-acetyltransferase [Shimwellia pseudoproteus]